MSNSLPYLAFQWRGALNLFHFARTVVTPNHNLRVNLPGNPLMKWCQFSLPFTFSGTFLFPFKKFFTWCWTTDYITGKTKRVPNKLFDISITVSIIRIDVLYRNLGFFLWQWLHGNIWNRKTGFLAVKSSECMQKNHRQTFCLNIQRHPRTDWNTMDTKGHFNNLVNE